MKGCKINLSGYGILKNTRQKISELKEFLFYYIIGLPTKEGIEKPIFDYEKVSYDSLLVTDFHNSLKHSLKHKHLWVKKATGLGVTEFFLRFMAWLCFRNNDDYKNSQMYY